MQFIDLQAQQRAYKPEIDARIAAVLAHGQFILGPEVRDLEEQLATFAGSRHCVTVGSGTVSLEIVLRALNIGPGDEVITSPFTFVATAEVIRLVGATPVFVDIDPKYYLINPDLIEAAITERTRAIMPVSLYGQMPDLERIVEIAGRHELVVIEDAAQSFGARRKGRRSCGAGVIGSTSFYPAKPLGCYGEGGALFTDDDAMADKFRALRNHGATQANSRTEVGTNGRFDTIQAAILLAKLPHFEDELASRERIAGRYQTALCDLCPTPQTMEGNTHVFAQYSIRVPNRDAVRKRLTDQGLPTAVHYSKGLHQQPVFADSDFPLSFPHTERAAAEVLNLPMHPFLSEDDQDRVVAGLTQALAN